MQAATIKIIFCVFSS